MIFEGQENKFIFVNVVWTKHLIYNDAENKGHAKMGYQRKFQLSAFFLS